MSTNSQRDDRSNATSERDPDKHPENAVSRVLDSFRRQSVAAKASYIFAALGALLAVHDYHHFHAGRFGYSTPLLGLAILLYALGLHQTR